jgi:transposase
MTELSWTRDWLGYCPCSRWDAQPLTLSTRIEPWEYDRAMYKRRNEVERLFRRLKGYRRIFSRFEKLDLMFLGFISFVLVADGLRMC